MCRPEIGAKAWENLPTIPTAVFAQDPARLNNISRLNSPPLREADVSQHDRDRLKDSPKCTQCTILFYCLRDFRGFLD